jgi:hypothetical protein
MTSRMQVLCTQGEAIVLTPPSLPSVRLTCSSRLTPPPTPSTVASLLEQP